MFNCGYAVEAYVKSLDRRDLLDLLVRPASEDVNMEEVEDLRPSKRKVIYAEVCLEMRPSNKLVEAAGMFE